MKITQVHSSLFVLMLALGVVATVMGLLQLYGSATVLLDSSFVRYFVIYCAFGLLAFEACSRWFRINEWCTGAAVVGVIVISTGTVWPLLVSVWFVLACFILGSSILSVLQIDKNNESAITRFLIGAGAYGTTAGLMAHFPINYPGVYGIALAIPVIFGWRLLTETACSLYTLAKQPSKFSWLDRAIMLIALVHFCVALMPEVGHDALATHLFIPAHLAYRHEWGFDVTTYVWAVMPMMGDWLFSIGYMLAGETAARMINVGFIFILSWLVRDMVLWAGGNAIGSRWAVLLFLTIPLTFTESSSLFIESVWAAFLLAGSLSVLKVLYADVNHKINLPVPGLLLGSALAAKAVTFTMLPALLLMFIWKQRIWFKINLFRNIILGLLLFILIGAIPYITAWYITGNPVFPFFNGYFQAPQYPAVNFSAPPIFEQGVSWDTIYRITFESGRYLESNPGAAGFQWLLLLLPALIMFIVKWNRRGLLLLFIGILPLVLAFQETAYLRYVFPSFAIFSAAIGVLLATVFSSKPDLLYRFVLVITISAISLNMLFFRSGTYYGTIALKPLLSDEGRSQYLLHKLPIRNAVELVNKLNNNVSPVAVFSSPLTAGLVADGLYPNWYNNGFQSLVQNASTTSSIAELLLQKGVDYVILDQNWGQADKRKIIEDATDMLAALGAISVRQLKKSYLFNSELLANSDFSEKTGWIQASVSSDQSSKQISVSVTSPAYQLVPVVEGRRYLNSVTAVCPDYSALGRIQVNWLDSRSDFISTDIRVFDCTASELSHSVEVYAPHDAAYAVVYATGHTKTPIVIKKVSFKQ